MLKLSVVLAVALASCVVGENKIRHQDITSVQGCNEFVDQLISTIGSCYEPYTFVEDACRKLNYKMLFVEVKVSLCYFDNEMTGLGSAVRTQDCKNANAYGYSGMMTSITFKDDITVQASANVSAQGYDSSDVTVKGQMKQPKANVFIAIKDQEIKLIYVMFNKLSKLTVQIDGLWGPLNTMSSFFSSFFVDIYRPYVVTAVEVALAAFLNKKKDDIQSLDCYFQ